MVGRERFELVARNSVGGGARGVVAAKLEMYADFLDTHDAWTE